MLKIIKALAGAATWLALQSATAAVPTELIEGMTETFPGTKQSGEFVELVPDQLWSWMSRPDDSQVFKPIPVVKYRGQYFYNNNRDSKTWSELRTGNESSAPEQFIQENIFMWMRDHAPTINIGKVDENSPIVYSAIECPACVELETRLAKNKKGYRVLPSSLKNQASDQYRAIVCAPDKTKSWVKAMTKRAIDGAASSSCRDNFRLTSLWGHIWNVDSYPTASAQGKPVVSGIQEILGLFSLKKSS